MTPSDYNVGVAKFCRRCKDYILCIDADDSRNVVGLHIERKVLLYINE